LNEQKTVADNIDAIKKAYIQLEAQIKATQILEEDDLNTSTHKFTYKNSQGNEEVDEKRGRITEIGGVEVTEENYDAWNACKVYYKMCLSSITSLIPHSQNQISLVK
jgi:hypothetical protein